MRRERSELLAALLIAGAVYVADRAVKLWCVRVLKAQGSMPFVPGLLQLTYAENRGAAFSMLSGSRWLLVGISSCALMLLAWLYLSRTFDHKLMAVALPLILGGALGNLTDRLRYGYVVDLFEVLPFRFAIFNVADCAITIGGCLMGLYLLLEFKHEREEGARG